MFWAILATSLSNIWKVFFKQTTNYKISANLNDFLGFSLALLCIFVIFLLWKFNIILSSFFDYFLILITFTLFLIQININQFVFRREKFSSLVPFENLWKILTILLWVFVLWEDISYISLWIFLLAIWVIIINSINFKTLKFSKNILLFCLAQCIVAVANFMTWYIIISNGSLSYYTVYILLSFLFVWSICFFTWQIKWIKKLDKKYYILRNIWWLVWVSWLINILLIWDLWLSVTTILWFFWIATWLITSYIVSKDIPTLRNVFVIIIVIALITLWYILK